MNGLLTGSMSFYKTHHLLAYDVLPCDAPCLTRWFRRFDNIHELCVNIWGSSLSHVRPYKTCQRAKRWRLTNMLLLLLLLLLVVVVVAVVVLLLLLLAAMMMTC